MNDVEQMNRHPGGCDLHTHTSASDGMNRPADNVRLAAERGLQAVAITDHDTVSGVDEALKAGLSHGIMVVPGVEISTRAGGKEIHILGYYVNTSDALFLERLANLRRTREARNYHIIDNLNKLGIPITMEDVISGLGRELKPDESIGRPHIADALVKKGHASNMKDAFERYLAEGRPAFAAQPRISPETACQWIRDAGGTPVIAHPGLYGDDQLVRDIVQTSKPAGIEVYHADHNAEDEQRYAALAEELGLIQTGGSDYHGERQGVVFHADLGGRRVSAAVLDQLFEAREAK